MIDKKLEEFLTEPANLEAVLELEPVIVDLKTAVFAQFWGHVAGILEERLDNGGYRWRLEQPIDVDISRSTLAIVDRNAPVATGSDVTNSRFSFSIGCLTGRPEAGHFGISRGGLIKTVDKSEDMILKLLKARGFKSDQWWSGYQYFGKAGIPTIDRTQVKTVLQLNEDNRINERPLALRTVGLLWSLFEEFHLMLEKLNDEWPYGEPKQVQ